MPGIDPLLLATVRIATFDGTRGLTSASGFFFRRDDDVAEEEDSPASATRAFSTRQPRLFLSLIHI